jgi:hypothetical protein
VNRFEQLLDLRLADAGHRRVGAHAAGVRAGVVVADALEVLGGREADRARTVGEREQRDLLSLEQLLHEHFPAECGRGSEPGVDLILRPADEDAFPRGEPVGLDHAGRLRDCQSPGGRDTCRFEHVLRERLRPLDPSGRLARAENRHTGAAKRVAEACDERRLGSDDDEFDPEFAAEREHPLAVLRPDGVTRSEPRDPGIPGCRVQFSEVGALAELPGQCMLAGRPTRR